MSGQSNGAAHHNNMADESDALLGKPRQRPLTTRLKRHLTSKLDRSWADVILLVCYVVTGLLDSSAVYIYGCFVSMQTGNTIYLGLGLVEPQSSNRWIRSIASIVAFCLGSFCFSRLHQIFVPNKRWVLMVSYLLQTLLIVGAAIIVTFGPPVSKEGPITIFVIAPICLIAFQSAGQAVTSRALKYNGITSVVLTTSYCDLFADPGLFTKSLSENPERNRRAIAPIMLLAGAVAGGLFANSRFGLEGSYWTAAGIKFLIVITWAFWKTDNESEED